MENFLAGSIDVDFSDERRGFCAYRYRRPHKTVALRMPDQEQTLELIQKNRLSFGRAESANTSGKPSPTTAQHVMHDLSGKIAGILDGGETQIGLESTVLDLTNAEGPVICARVPSLKCSWSRSSANCQAVRKQQMKRSSESARDEVPTLCSRATGRARRWNGC